MFKKWFSKAEKEIEVEEKETSFKSLEDQSGWIVYSVDEDGIINMDFDLKSDKLSNEHFSELFHQINNGDLLENAISFIKQSLEDDDRSSDLEEFNDNIDMLNKLRGNLLLDLLTQNEEEEVVVKPTDIAKIILKDEHK
tara:strand:- start:23 stop:439 length:417 start_codon:yes stop_codon:yes gene_type:complete